MVGGPRAPVLAAMFEKYELWQFKSPGPGEILAQSMAFWQRAGYSVTPTTAQTFQGRSIQPRLGFHRIVDMAVFPSPEGLTTVQIHFRASLTDEGLVAGAVVGIILLPVAVVGGAISWNEYEEDWVRARWDYWNYLITLVRAQPLVVAPAVPPPVPPPPSFASALPAPPPPAPA